MKDEERLVKIILVVLIVLLAFNLLTDVLGFFFRGSATTIALLVLVLGVYYYLFLRGR